MPLFSFLEKSTPEGVTCFHDTGVCTGVRSPISLVHRWLVAGAASATPTRGARAAEDAAVQFGAGGMCEMGEMGGMSTRDGQENTTSSCGQEERDIR